MFHPSAICGAKMGKRCAMPVSSFSGRLDARRQKPAGNPVRCASPFRLKNTGPHYLAPPKPLPLLNREFLLNILFLVFINLLIKPFFIFGIDLTVQNRVPEGDYGLYFTLFNFTYLFQILSDFGVQNFNNRHVSQHPHLLEKYFPNLLFIKLLLIGLYVGFSLAAAALAHYDERAVRLLFVLLVNQALVQLILFLRSNVSGLGHYRLDSLLSSLDKFLMLITCGLVLWWPPLQPYFSVEAFALAQTLALALTGIAVYVVLRSKTTGLRLRPSWSRDWSAGLPTVYFLFIKSFPYALVILLMTAFTRLDAVLLERMEGPLHADVYAGGYRLLDAANMFGFLFATLLLPMFARLLRHREPVRPLVSLSFKLIWAGSVTLAAAVFFARQELVALMMPERASAYRWETLGILIWTFVPVCATYIFSTLLTAGERLMAMNRVFLVALLLDIALDLWLIPRWQARGAAIATLSTQSFVAAGMVWLCARDFGFRASARGVGQALGFGVAVVAADWFVFEKTGLAWPGKLALAFGAGIAATLVFRLPDWRQVFTFLEIKRPQ